MGQRLVLTIKDSSLNKDIEDGAEFRDESRDKNNLMKIYYHWSAYTHSAQEELMNVSQIIRHAKNNGKSTKDILLEIIRFVQVEDRELTEYFNKQFPKLGPYCCAGGIDGGKGSHEWKYITKLYPNEKFRERADRNQGLVAMSPEGMDMMQYWSEGDCVIDINTGDCWNDIIWEYDDFDDWFNRGYYQGKQKYLEEAKKQYENAPVVTKEFWNYNFNDKLSELIDIKTQADIACRGDDGIFKDKDGHIYEIVA